MTVQTATPFQFEEKASKTKRKARIALVGYEGSGKTYTGLVIGTALAAHDGKRLLLADSEGDSAKIYADRFDFAHGRLSDHSPESYRNALDTAVTAGFGALFYDSMSHEWIGSGGALEMKDRLSVGPDSDGFRAWGKVTPEHNKVFAGVVNAPIHIVASMRQKKAYVVEQNAKGKSAPRLIGTEAVQREGAEYEFDLILTFERDGNIATIAKSRYVGITQGARFAKPGADLVALIIAALDEGADPPAPAPVRTPNEVDGLTQAVITDLAKRANGTARAITQAFLAQKGYASWGDFIQYGADDAQVLIDQLTPQPEPVAPANGQPARSVAEQAELLKPAGAKR
ncbi:MAG TPA: AAA family ATPase [Candidatus Limnocylindria bacterium]|nr:AAA family ATPase [Candidatus Limnocylindria bacterium]